MSKKTMIITLVDGRKILRDLSEMAAKLPIAMPANAPDYINVVANVSVAGITESESPSHVHHVPASQIQSIDIKFE